MTSRHPVLILFILFLISGQVFGQKDCDIKKDDEEIVVSLCDSEISDFKTIQVELDIPATLSQYAAQLLDIENYLAWQYKSLGTKTVKQVSNTELYYYTKVETPWPVNNRDLILHLKLWQDSTTQQLYQQLISVPDFLPEEEGYVRIPFSESLLTVTPIDKGNVHVQFIMDIDPGGYVPPWIANMFAAMAPWNTFKSFRNNIIEQGENRVTVPFIMDYE
ncbi:MAG: START domain-containing protein [Bacteroidota bacterium]